MTRYRYVRGISRTASRCKTPNLPTGKGREKEKKNKLLENISYAKANRFRV